MDIKKEYKTFEKEIKNKNAKYILILALILFVLAFVVKIITSLLIFGAIVALVIGLYHILKKN